MPSGKTAADIYHELFSAHGVDRVMRHEKWIDAIIDANRTPVDYNTATGGQMKYYEQELDEYKEAYEKSTFVPFPNVQRAIEALVETANAIIDGDAFLADVLTELQALVDSKFIQP